MKYLPLSQGYWTTIDDDDFERASKYKWHYNNGYAKWAKIGSKAIFLHRFIINAPDGAQVDHINRDKLDNRKANLRLCTNTENAQNRASWGNMTGYRGVYLSGPRYVRSPFKAVIRINGKTTHLGYFKTAIEAAKAYNEAALKYHKDFAVLNPVI